jgi:tRNA (guanine37-N1)-methyltransferase
MKFNILTIFPEMFTSYLNESILGRAQKNKLIKFNILNIRDFTTDKHRKTDDSPFGGGPGMVMKVEPIFNALKTLKKSKTRIILLSAKGKTFDAKEAKRLSKYKNLTFICGRYEGVDERVAKYLADEEMSIGNYVLTGGELPAMVIVDAVSRFIPGVLGKEESLKEESFSFESNKKLEIGNWKLEIQKEYPQYTRPEVFSPKKGVKWAVPKILLSGDHKKIEEWRKKQRS